MEILQTWGTAMDPFCGMLEENAAKLYWWLGYFPVVSLELLNPQALGVMQLIQGVKR